MKIVSAKIEPSVEASDSPGGPSFCEASVAFRVIPETAEDRDLLIGPNAKRGMLLQWIQDIVTATVPEPSPPFIVVSVRPQLDGAPTRATRMGEHDTHVVPIDMIAVGPTGEPVRVSVPLEVRASVQ